MRKILILLAILLITISETFAYAVKVYDQWGNRLGTYRKEGDNFVLYDFYDKKVENPEDLIQNAPSQRTLSEYTQYFYDENMLPIGSFSTGLWSNTGRYYPRGRYLPRCFYPSGSTNYIVRPTARGGILNTNYTNFPPPPPPRSNKYGNYQPFNNVKINGNKPQTGIFEVKTGF